MKKLFAISAAAMYLVAGADYQGKGIEQKGARLECVDKCDQILKDEKAAEQSRRGRQIHLVNLDDRSQI